MKLPEEGWIKVNCDGASRGNPGRSGIGFCLRDDRGDVKYAAGREIEESSNNEAEVKAMVEALRVCKVMNYLQICLQTDSMLLKNIIEGLWKPPWTIIDQIEEIMKFKEEHNIKVSHTYREGNRLADHLANYALDVEDIECYDYWELDAIGRRIVNEDKHQWPYLRIKVARN